MNVWVICIGEPLPIDEGHQRYHRAGMLTSAFASMGHNVTWWTSAFNHSFKVQRTDCSQETRTADGIRLWLLHGVAYTRNVGVMRLINHAQLAREFRRLAKDEPVPDVIFCCWPSIELSVAAVEFAEHNSVPIILDVRDLWPDIFLDAAPPILRPAGKLMLAPYERMTHFAFTHATGVVGISQGYLDWGLAKAGRPSGPHDGLFPLGYTRPEFKKGPVEDGLQVFRSMGLDESRMICWFLGSFGSTYDLGPVICAARRIEERGEHSPIFVFSGDGGDREKYERLAIGLRNVLFTGWLDADKIASMMRIANVAIAAYRKGAPQGLPNKIFEYMAAGLPILSSLDGECKSFLSAHACGISYEADSPEAFDTALQPFIQDPLLARKLGSNGLAAFRERYSSSIIYPRLVEFTLDLAVSGRSQKDLVGCEYVS
jgi:glycosyltransferase involved in cell wall biosynthesis